MKSKRKPCTAAELMARLQADPDWVRRDAERRAKHAALVAQTQREIEPEHAPLIAELAAAGVKVRMNAKAQLTLPPDQRPGDAPLHVQSIDDLVNTRDSYPEAIPILVRHMHTVQHPIMVDTIARALTVKEARGTGAVGIILYRLKHTKPSPTEAGDEYQARWALANALTVLADGTVLEEIQRLLQDEHYQDVWDRLRIAVKRADSDKRA